MTPHTYKNLSKDIRTLRELSPHQLRDLIVKILDDNKAENIEIIDLSSHSILADYMIVASGRSSRQVTALADKIQEAFAHNNLHTPKAEGKSQGDWVVLDCGDIFVHLFRPEVREFYNIEKMWRAHPIAAETPPSHRSL